MTTRILLMSGLALSALSCRATLPGDSTNPARAGKLTFDKTASVALRDLVDFLQIQHLHFDLKSGPPSKLLFRAEVYQDGQLVPGDVVTGLTVQPPDYVTVFFDRTDEGLILKFYCKTASTATNRIAQLARPANAFKSTGSFELKPGVQVPLYLSAVDTGGVGSPDGLDGFRQDAKRAKAALVLSVEAVVD